MQTTIFDSFKDLVPLKVCTSVNAFNERVFSTATTIKCRIVETDTIIKTEKAEFIKCKFKIYTKTKVSTLDNLNGLDVLLIKEHKSLVTNQVLGYSVYI